MTEQEIHLFVTFPIFKPLRRLNASFRKSLIRVLKSTNPRFKSANKPTVEELNQFMFASIICSDHIYFDIQKRKELEDKIDRVYTKYRRIMLKKLKNLYKEDSELKNTLKTLKEVSNELNLSLDDEIKQVENIPETIIEEIRSIFTNGSLIIWDMPDEETDRIIAGYEKINRQGDSTKTLDIGVVSDELALATFGKYHVPSILAQIKHIEEILIDLPEKLINFEKGFTSIEDNSEKEFLMEVTGIFLGKLFGIRESFNLAQKQLQRYLDLENELNLESKTIGSTFLSSIFGNFINKEQIFEMKILCNGIEALISDNSDKIRDIANTVENLQPDGKTSSVVMNAVKFVMHMYLHLEEFRFTTETFQDIPNYTAMPGGIAIESDRKIEVEIPSDSAIYLKDVFRTFPLLNNTIYALRGINLDIKKGEFVAIMGPSGSGKTTLLNIMSSLDKPDRGLVKVDGLDLSIAKEKHLIKFRRDQVAFIYQSYNLLPVLTNHENITLPADFGTQNKIENIDSRASVLLEQVGLDKYSKQRPLLLSGGQQQRITISRGLMNQANIIFCDEPTGDLDSETGNKIIEILEELNEQGITIVLVTHDCKIGQRADRIINIDDGKIMINN